MGTEQTPSHADAPDAQSTSSHKSALDIARPQLNEAASHIDVDTNVIERLNYRGFDQPLVNLDS